ncbi:MAG: hypothetical protein ACE5EY_15630 [Anaerolineae bacterium]
MRKSVLPFLFIILLTACGSGNNTPPSPNNEPRPTPTTAVSPTNNPNPTPTPDAYPPAPPAPTSLPEDYPAQPPVPPTSPYPTGLFTWLTLPVGKQCEEGKSYDNLATAVNDLANAGVAVKTAETVELAVCSACGCPTSAHYRVEIDVDGLDAAIALGWQEE